MASAVAGPISQAVAIANNPQAVAQALAAQALATASEAALTSAKSKFDASKSAMSNARKAMEQVETPAPIPKTIPAQTPVTSPTTTSTAIPASVKSSGASTTSAPTTPLDAKGVFITDYKGYSLYKKDTGFGIDLDAYIGTTRYGITTYASSENEASAVALAKARIDKGALK